MNNKKFHYVIVDEGEPACVGSHASMHKLKRALKDWFSVHPCRGRRQVFVFHGTRISASAGVRPNLWYTNKSGTNKLVPLYDKPADTPPSDDGLVADDEGTDSYYAEVTKAIAPAKGKLPVKDGPFQ